MGGLLGLGGIAVAAVAALVAGLVQIRRAVVLDGAPVQSQVVRSAATWRWAGVVVGLVVSGAVVAWDVLGRGLMLAAPVFGICVLAGVLVGEASVRPLRGPTRQATLEVRRVRDYLPRGLTRTVIAAAVLLLVLLIATTATGSADDLGRAGRVLQVQCRSVDTPGAIETQTRSPWPGSFYSVPLVLVVMGGLAAAWAALRQIVRRPRAGDDATAVAGDDVLRQRAARGVTGACGILVTVPLVGVSYFTAPPLLNMTCLPGWSSVAGFGLLVLIPGMIALICWCMAAVIATTPTARTSRSSA